MLYSRDMNSKNPFIIRLQQAIALFTIFATAASSFFGWPMISLFTLNTSCYQHLFLWQPLTSLFFIPEFDFGFWPLIDVIFVLMLFGLLANQALETLGRHRYTILFGITTLLSSIAALFTMYLTGFTEPLSMLYPLLLAHVVIWTMFTPAKNVALWMLFPLSSKWLLVLALIGTIGKNLLTAHFELAAAYASSVFVTYIASIMWLHLSSPFMKLWPFEAFLRRNSLAISRFWNWKIMAPIRKWRNTTTVIK